jgi:hypothetical protein
MQKKKESLEGEKGKDKKEKKKPLQISEVLDTYLRETYALRYVTVVQVVRLLYGTKMYHGVNKRYRALSEAKYVHDFMLPTTKRLSPYIYVVSAKGCRYLREEDGIDATEYYKPSELEELSHSFLWHILQTNDFIIAARTVGKVQENFYVNKWWHDLDMKKKPLVVRYEQKYTGKEGEEKTREVKKQVVPDAFIDFRKKTETGKVWQYAYWLELDRGTEAESKFKDKIEKIYMSIKKGVAAEYFGVKRISGVLFSTTAGEGRAALLRKYAMEKLAELHANSDNVALFLFGVQPHDGNIDIEQMFFTKYWFEPRKEKEAVALLV